MPQNTKVKRYNPPSYRLGRGLRWQVAPKSSRAESSNGTNTMKQINTLAELKADCVENGGCGEFFVSLNGGLKSSKTIYWEEEGDDFNVIHEVDFSDETFDDHTLMTESIIGEAMMKGALYSYND